MARRSRLLLLLLLLPGCGGEKQQPLPDGMAWREGRRGILLVTFDTTRADRLGCYGYEDAVTPTIDRLAREGIVYEQAATPAPITLPSHVSILTGVYPTAHGIRDNLIFRLAPDARLISEVLQDRGWRTAAFVGSYMVDARFGLDQGFETYRGMDVSHMPMVTQIMDRRAGLVADDAVAWLETVQPSEDFFLWLHFYDPHEPYVPPEPWKDRIEDPYDAEISYSDEQLGLVLQWMERRGLADNLLCVMTSDHGESLEQHGERTHGIFVYQTTLRVPLILSGPPLRARAGTRVRQRVSNADLPATLLALLGLPPHEMPATRMPPLPLQDVEPIPQDRPLYLECFLPYYSHRWHPYQGLIWGDQKYIAGKQRELYLLDRDPDELHDLAAQQPDRIAKLQQRLEATCAEHAALGWVESRTLDAEDMERVAALGYTAGSEGEEPFDASLPDPRERIGDLDALDRAILRFHRGRELFGPRQQQGEDSPRRAQGRKLLESTRNLLDRVLAGSPQDARANFYRGTACFILGDYEQAAPSLEIAVAMFPGQPMTHFNLGLCYFQMQRPADAIPHLQEAIRSEPRFADAYHVLIDYHASQREFGRAAWWADRLVEVAAAGEAQQQARAKRRLVRRSMQQAGQSPTPPPSYTEDQG